ncbi:hypothetical protein Acr_08g0015020 [Actinidia rufa]|uniref:Reverse transcriptase zinc-binding domain-containing protein n=1 Tax=Actinidia rufa TaxID=165716 RepID=A0A7J0F3W4_9ERIC|nr:hypothetical protein Acr_08g0015020 [Actinidia rufa]
MIKIRGASSFKFFNMWAQHESFLDIVTNVWSMRVEGTAMFRLCKKLKALKDPLKALNKHNFSHISVRVEVAEEALNQAQQNAHDNPGDVSLQIKVSELRVKAIKLDEAERSSCAQLAKAKYLKHSDRGTKFFHDLIKSNRARNQIISLTKADGDIPSVKLSLDCLKQFGDVSGLRINANKSNVFMAGINSVDTESIKAITGFSVGKFPFRYLEIPVAAARLTIECELIRSVLQGIECFWLSILPIPVGVRDKVIALCRNFLWGGKATSPKKPLVAWKDLCKPKSEGGLAFIDLNTWNVALMSKSLWNLHAKKDTLWVKWPERETACKRKADGQIEDTSCVLCGDPVESVSHLFFQCTIVRQIWAEIKGWLGFSRALTTLEATAKWIVKEGMGTGVPAIAKKLGFAATVYCIWKTRNARIFEGKVSHTADIVRDIKLQVFRGLHETFPNLQNL